MLQVYALIDDSVSLVRTMALVTTLPMSLGSGEEASQR